MDINTIKDTSNKDNKQVTTQANNQLKRTRSLMIIYMIIVKKKH